MSKKAVLSFFMVITMILSGALWANEMATTDTGQRVRLFDEGSGSPPRSRSSSLTLPEARRRRLIHSRSTRNRGGFGGRPMQCYSRCI